MERQEKKLILDIKKSAKENQMVSCKARLVRNMRLISPKERMQGYGKGLGAYQKTHSKVLLYEDSVTSSEFAYPGKVYCLCIQWG